MLFNINTLNIILGFVIVIIVERLLNDAYGEFYNCLGAYQQLANRLSSLSLPEEAFEVLLQKIIDKEETDDLG